MNTKEIAQLFNDWNKALQTGNPKEVVKLYAKDSILIPTLSNQVRHNDFEKENYFIDFLKRKAQGMINESNIRIYDDIAIHSGIYTFSFINGDTAKARFTFVYKKENSKWLIIEHHSSLFPE